MKAYKYFVTFTFILFLRSLIIKLISEKPHYTTALSAGQIDMKFNIKEICGNTSAVYSNPCISLFFLLLLDLQLFLYMAFSKVPCLFPFL